MRRLLTLASLIASLTLPLGAAARAEPSILFDVATGKVIESEDAFARWYPASLTKLMTTYVAFRMVQAGEVTLASPIRMSEKAAKEQPSKMGYPPGSVLTLDNAIKILMVKSANDVAAAVGESLGGSQAGFAARMNVEAARLGMTGSRWVNANGWHDDNQWTTARDLAILATALRREFPQYAYYFALDGIAAGKAAIPNHNTLIGRFDGADGMKTGYTCPSGYNLVGSATRDGRTLMAVVVGSKSVGERAEKAAAMLARGFATTNLGPDTLASLKPSGQGIGQITNMIDQLCSKGARARMAKEAKAKAKAEKAAKKAAPEQDEDDAAVEKSVYLKEFDHPRKLVPVTLGGATGPAPKGLIAQLIAEAKAQATAQAKAGVPLPTWRPDLPTPPGVEPMLAPLVVQGNAGGLSQ